MAFQTGNQPTLQKMLDEAVRFCCSVKAQVEPYWLMLLGPSGVGKTHLAKRIWRRFFDEIRLTNQMLDVEQQHIYGTDGQFVDWRKLCDQMREGCFGRVDDICNEWLVVVDDIGAEYDPNGFLLSKLDQILNARLKKFTVLTSNLPFAEIATKLDTRIASRMLRNNGVIVETDAHDFNMSHTDAA